MTDVEKARQVTEAVFEYQNAKFELGHIDKRLRSVFGTYQLLGTALNENRGSLDLPSVSDGKLDLGIRAHKFDQSFLLNAVDLIYLLHERDAAQVRVETALQEMQSLGVVGIS